MVKLVQLFMPTEQTALGGRSPTARATVRFLMDIFKKVSWLVLWETDALSNSDLLYIAATSNDSAAGLSTILWDLYVSSTIND